MENIIIGVKTKVTLLDIEYDLQVLPLSPSVQVELVGEDYLEKSQRLEELEKKDNLLIDEREELSRLRRDLSAKMEDISIRKIGYMVQSKDKEDFIATVKELKLGSHVVEILEEALKKSNSNVSK